MSAPALHAEGVSKVYGGEVALAGAGVVVEHGEIHALVGANGAGKSTLVRILCGVERPDAGAVAVDGRPLPVPYGPAVAREAGIAHIHQDRALVGDLSIAENIALSLGYPLRAGLLSPRAMRAQARRALDAVRLGHDVDTPVKELPIADQTMVAIARALASDATVILLDEPTANLGAARAEELYARLGALAEEGVACLLITHALSEALELCDHVTVLRDGRVAAARPASSLDEHALAELMLGHRPARESHAPPAVRAEVPRLRLDGLRYDLVEPISLEVGAGEIVAVTGLADSGHLLLSEPLTGATPPQAGQMWLDGEPFAPADVGAARRHGVVAVPADRARDGVALGLTARENVFLNPRGNGRLRLRAERGAAQTLLRDALVKPPDTEAVLTTLSGGNMQKVLLARCLAEAKRVLVLAEPTVGVDVGARDDVYRRIRRACADGLAVLLLSSDAEEVAELADRVFVLRHGAVTAYFDRDDATVAAITAAAAGSAR